MAQDGIFRSDNNTSKWEGDENVEDEDWDWEVESPMESFHSEEEGAAMGHGSKSEVEEMYGITVAQDGPIWEDIIDDNSRGWCEDDADVRMKTGTGR